MLTELDSFHRSREFFHGLVVPQGMWAIIRVDGRSFSRHCADMKKPFDEGFSRLMRQVTAGLMTELGGLIGYTESDEISILLPQDTEFFSREVEKLVSVSAGLATAYLHKNNRDFDLDTAHFDSRVWIGASLSDVASYFEWRQLDASRCALNSLVYWTEITNGASVSAATRLANAQAKVKHDYLYDIGINFAYLPAAQRVGSMYCWRHVPHVGVDQRTGQEVPTTRRRIVPVNMEIAGRGLASQVQDIVLGLSS